MGRYVSRREPGLLIRREQAELCHRLSHLFEDHAKQALPTELARRAGPPLWPETLLELVARTRIREPCILGVQKLLQFGSSRRMGNRVLLRCHDEVDAVLVGYACAKECRCLEALCHALKDAIRQRLHVHQGHGRVR
jgi:hypothetical protein